MHPGRIKVIIIRGCGRPYVFQTSALAPSIAA